MVLQPRDTDLRMHRGAASPMQRRNGWTMSENPTTQTRNAAKKDAILEATVRLVAQNGAEAATMRAIAREVGVTEAAIYRHYASKEELWLTAYARVLDEIIVQREHLILGDGPIRARIREWVRLTFQYYDNNPQRFTYAFLVPGVVSFAGAAEKQKSLPCRTMLETAMQSGSIRTMPPQLAQGYLMGLAHSVPHQINVGTLAGPAVQYIDEVAETVWRVFAPEPNTMPHALAAG